jgi:hypothetical protein
VLVRVQMLSTEFGEMVGRNIQVLVILTSDKAILKVFGVLSTVLEFLLV